MHKNPINTIQIKLINLSNMEEVFRVSDIITETCRKKTLDGESAIGAIRILFVDRAKQMITQCADAIKAFNNNKTEPDNFNKIKNLIKSYDGRSDYFKKKIGSTYVVAMCVIDLILTQKKYIPNLKENFSDFDNLLRISRILAEQSEVKTISSRSIQSAVRIIHGDNSSDIVNHCTRTITQYNSNNTTPDNFSKTYKLIKTKVNNIDSNIVDNLPWLSRKIIGDLDNMDQSSGKLNVGSGAVIYAMGWAEHTGAKLE